MKLRDIIEAKVTCITRSGSDFHYLRGIDNDYHDCYQWPSNDEGAYYDDGRGFDIEDVLADDWTEVPFEEWPYFEQKTFDPAKWRSLHYPGLTDDEFMNQHRKQNYSEESLLKTLLETKSGKK